MVPRCKLFLVNSFLKRVCYFRAECESYVKGFPGARYKKFSTEDEAETFVSGSGAGSHSGYSTGPARYVSMILIHFILTKMIGSIYSRDGSSVWTHLQFDKASIIFLVSVKIRLCIKIIRLDSWPGGMIRLLARLYFPVANGAAFSG